MRINKVDVDLDTFIGQNQAKENLFTLMNEIDDKHLFQHLLLIGNSGAGKTTFATAIHRSCLKILENLSYFALPTGKTILDVNTLKNLLVRSGKKPSIYFFDEAHVMKPDIQEALYEPMDKGQIFVYHKTGSYPIKLPPVILIAATTEPGKLLEPFQNRFLHIVFEAYKYEEIAAILKQYNIEEGELTLTGAIEIAQRSKNNPRVAWDRVRRVVNWCNQNGVTSIDQETAAYALDSWGVDQFGLTGLDWRYLKYLQDTLQPQGIQNIASIIDVDDKYIEHIIEPYLLTEGWVIKTRSGRQLTPRGSKMIADIGDE
jgi:holliday junction DNA helicase RuvB